jgi:hypothetical protein
VTEKRPHFGHSHGLPVHLHTRDHLAPAAGSRWPTRFNAWLAVKISRGVGSMWCAYIFAAIALWGLPAALKPGGEGIVSWVAQTFLQLVLLSVIMVGQDVMGRASDARAAKTFDDAEAAKEALIVALDRLDEKTEGGLKAVLDAVNASAALTEEVKAAVRAATSPATVMTPVARPR